MPDHRPPIEGPCAVPGCEYRYHRPARSWLLLCPLHLRRYKARQTLPRVRRYQAKLKARQASARKMLDTLAPRG